MRHLAAIVITALGLFAVVQNAEAATCDCNHFPWKPETCVNLCGGLVLSLANSAELTKFLDVTPATAQKVILLRKNSGNKINSLESLKPSLSQEEYEKIIQSIGGLEPLEAEYLVQPPDERRDFHMKLMAAPPSPV